MVTEELEKGNPCCELCGAPIQEDQECYEIRYGYLENKQFSPQEDVSLVCAECGVLRGNYNSW